MIRTESMPQVSASSILEHSPNGIVLVDDEARIQYVNPAFRRMFGIGGKDLRGRKAAEILQSDCFERMLRAEGDLSVRGSLPERGVCYRATLFRIEGEHRACGIFIDTSEEERARAELAQVKRETLARAQEVIRRQMQTAQEIAGLLGETTAETKVLLARLSDLLREEGTP
ncbi:MAG TPA: PAS domain S-box protein [Planctomycetaceae bacterium]|nr:PAS domain S-box protein [Planctomycetaceae bacterium]HIQ20711.1 PAS domain S-box protein [Planctomycetota bacterium]